MATRITFTDKTNNRLEPSIPADKKASAGDMNEIKAAVNDHADDIESTDAALTALNAIAVVNPMTADFDMGGFDILNIGNSQELAASTVALSGQALVPVLLNNIVGTYYGTQASPATTGDLAVSAAGVASGFAHIYYQAASVPIITGIDDVNITADWDGTNINILIVYQDFEGQYLGRHVGTL